MAQRAAHWDWFPELFHSSSAHRGQSDGVGLGTAGEIGQL